MNGDQVHQATEAFYAALNCMFDGDLGPMSQVWSHAPDVINMGPFGGRQVGWESVRARFEREAGLNFGGRVTAEDIKVGASGDLGYNVCKEVGENMTMDGAPIQVQHRATNIFRRENDLWKLVLHHTDEVPALQEEARRKGK
jgi:ketosteroid isomerase-like protein